MSIFRYRLDVPVSEEDIDNQLPPGITATVVNADPTIEQDINLSDDSGQADLDGYMSSLGWTNIGQDPTEPLLPAVQSGLARIVYPLDAGIRSASTAVDATTNNGMPALAFLTGQDGFVRWSVRPPQNHISGDLTMRIYYSIATAQGGPRVVDLQFAYNFVSDLDPLGVYTTVDVAHSVQGQVIDEIFAVDFVMPEADFNAAKDFAFFRVARLGATGGNDNFANSIFMHAIEFQYNGWILAGQPLGA